MNVRMVPYLGYGLLEAWSICILFSNNSTALAASAVFNSDLDYTALCNISGLAVVLGTLVLVLASRKKDVMQHKLKSGSIAAMLNAIGTLLILLGDVEAGIAGLFLSGFANAWLWVSWGGVFAALDTEEMEGVVVASTIFQSVVVVAILILPVFVQTVSLFLLAPASYLLYCLSMRDIAKRASSRQHERKLHTAISFTDRFAVRLISGLGIPIALTYFLLVISFPIPALQNGFDVVLVAGLLLFCVVLYILVRILPSFTIPSICRTLLLLVVVAVVVTGLDLPPVDGAVIVVALMLLCQYLVLMYSARLYGQGFGNVTFTFGVGQLLNHASGLIGGLAGLVISGFLHANEVSISSVAIVVLAISFLVVLLSHNDGAYPLPEPLLTVSANGTLEEYARAAGLSKREVEIFVLLAKGRSAPFIRDELVVSLNTVNTHIKHIYSKLDIHSRQELFDLIDSLSIQRG